MRKLNKDITTSFTHSNDPPIAKRPKPREFNNFYKEHVIKNIIKEIQLTEDELIDIIQHDRITWEITEEILNLQKQKIKKLLGGKYEYKND